MMLLLCNQVFLFEVFIEPIPELLDSIEFIIRGAVLQDGIGHVTKNLRNEPICVSFSLNGAHSGGEHDYIGKVVTIDEVDEFISEFPHLSGEDT